MNYGRRQLPVVAAARVCRSGAHRPSRAFSFVVLENHRENGSNSRGCILWPNLKNDQDVGVVPRCLGVNQDVPTSKELMV